MKKVQSRERSRELRVSEFKFCSIFKQCLTYFDLFLPCLSQFAKPTMHYNLSNWTA